MSNSSISEYDQFILPITFPLPLTFVISGCVVVAIIVGTLGNILIWLSIAQTKQLKTATNFFVAHLAVSDLGNCLFSFPTLLPVLFGNDFLLNNVVLCKVRFYFASICSSQSVLTLNLIAFNRYFLVTKKSKSYQRLFNQRSTTVLVTLLWSFTVVVVLLPEMGVGRVVPVGSLSSCLVEPGDFESWLYWTLLVCGSFFFCYVAIPIFYYLTFLAAKRSRRKVVNHAPSVSRCPPASQNAISRSVSLAGQSAKRCHRNCKKEERRFTLISAVVHLTFTICWTPMCLVHLLNWRHPIPAWVYHLCFLLIYTNSCINPFIYAGTNRRFRKKMKQLLRLE